MRYKCPYCDDPIPEIPRNGHCIHCGRVMRVPSPTTPEERGHRQRRIERIRFEADKRIAEISHVSDGRVLRSPKVLFGFMLCMMILGVSLMRRPALLPRAIKESPNEIAQRQLNTLAAALGRYHFHVGDYPPGGVGLTGLLNNPGAKGWNGPYINQLRRDPWQTPYQYKYVSNSLPQLFSHGPDTRPGTSDDLHAAPMAFDPGEDWTNGWVRAIHRQPGTLIMRREWLPDELAH